MKKLPSLPFGNAGAIALSDGCTATEVMSGLVPSMRLVPLGKPSDFHARVAVRRLADLTLVANSTSPSRMDVDDAQGWHLVMPCYGSTQLLVGGHGIEATAGNNAVLLPNCRRSAINATRCTVILPINVGRLARTRAAIAGGDPADFGLGDDPADLAMSSRRLFLAFLRLCALLETTAGDDALAEDLALADGFWRWTATLMGASTGPVPPEHGMARQQQGVDLVCDMVRSTSERPFSLTEMETITGLSTRSLQNAFRRRFALSPMAWQRRERMEMARQRLLESDEGTTITEVAHAMGFSSSSAFSTLYVRHFGEPPSRTMRSYRPRR